MEFPIEKAAASIGGVIVLSLPILQHWRSVSRRRNALKHDLEVLKMAHELKIRSDELTLSVQERLVELAEERPKRQAIVDRLQCYWDVGIAAVMSLFLGFATWSLSARETWFWAIFTGVLTLSVALSALGSVGQYQSKVRRRMEVKSQSRMEKGMV